MLSETSATKHQSTPRSTVEEWSFSVQCGESLKSGDSDDCLCNDARDTVRDSQLFNQNFKQYPSSTGLCNINY